jgi:hypothetical protein
MGIRLMPWQESAARYLTATSKDGMHLYREVCIVVARQNGKTALMKPYIVQALKAGRRVLHIAQNRELPREMFGLVADALSAEPDLFQTRRGKIIWPRYGSGQEEILLKNGAKYRIAASNRGGARGKDAIDLLIIDELREQVDWDVISAAEPTMTMSADPQTVYLSNMGDDDSVVLNSLRARAGHDPHPLGAGPFEPDASLAYLEWSAAPHRADDDREGWAEANPALGHFPQVLRELERTHRARKADGQMGIFETERLCRRSRTMREPLVAVATWVACAEPALPPPVKPYLAVSMDPSGGRASVAMAWRLDDGRVALRMLGDFTGSADGKPIDTDKLGRIIKEQAREHRAQGLGFDPMTDTALSRFADRSHPISATTFANASARFVTAIAAGTLRWTDAAPVTEDLLYTTRKVNDEKGSFEAVRGKDDRPITASLAAIRAVWLASDPPKTKRASF